MRHAALALFALLLCAGHASAQPYSPPSKGPAIGIRGFFAVDANMMAATDSFKATFDSAEMTAYGGGGEIDIWKGLFGRVAITRAQKTGTRAFVDNGQVFPLGISETVTLTPIEAGAGYRFAPRGRICPYAGAAFVSLGYDQVSDQAEAGDNVSERHNGVAVFGGATIGLAKGFFFGVEGQYRRIHTPDASRSLMHEFGENDLGGVGARVTIGFSTK